MLHTTSSAQIGVNYHQWSAPSLGLTYEFGDNFLTELRLGSNLTYFSIGMIERNDLIYRHTFFSTELMASYKIINRQDYFLYGGIGAIYFLYPRFMGSSAAFVIPVGVAIFPFENNNFGLHIEGAPMVSEGLLSFRTSWGFRYRFN